jgi:PKD repeat protein
MPELLEHRHRRRAPVFALALVIAAVVLAAIATSSARAIATLTVSNLPLAPVEGQAYTGPVATATDSETGFTASEYNATIEWGDGLTQSGTVTVSGEEITILTPEHTYAEEGSNTLTVTVGNTTQGIHGSDATTLAVADASLFTIPFAAPTTFAASGPGTSTTLSIFETAIGGADNATKAGEQPAGLRHINWDQIALDGSQSETIPIAPGHTVAISAGSQQNRGVRLDSPIAVSGDGFASVNPSVTGLFGFLSAPNIAAPFNSNAFALHIVAPAAPGATPVPAATRAFGAVFLNVTLPNTTSIEYLDGETVLAKLFAPVAGHHQPSFVGALFASPAITGVVITLGTARILSFNGTNSLPGPLGDSLPNNLVAADDLVLAEPAPAPVPAQLTLAATAGVPLSGVLASFQDANPNANAHDSLATVDWGDGSSSQGLIEANASGGYGVSGTHTYTQAGAMPVAVDVRDLGGAHITLHATVAVSSPVATPPLGILPGPAPTPIPASTPPPHCSLTVSSPALARVYASHGAPAEPGAPAGPGAIAARAKAKHRKTAPRKRLRASASCDEETSVELTATATLTPAGKRTHKATTLALGREAATLNANHPATLTIEVPSATLTKLQAAVAHHQRISARLTLTATNAHGSSSTSTTVASLRL